MRLTVVSSLDALCRRQACRIPAAASPDAVVIQHDLLDGGLITRRIQRRGQPVQRRDAAMEHGCPSCAVRFAVVPTVAELLDAGESHVILGLPTTTPAATAIHAILQRLPGPITVDAAVLACSPSDLEDQLWDRRSLFEAGCATVAQDERTSGEFLIGELAYGDTVLTVETDVLPVDESERERGLQLLQELAPHALRTRDDALLRPGRYDPIQAIHRSTAIWAQPTGARTASDSQASPFRTLLHEVTSPLDPERFQLVLPSLAEGCCWLRGHVWLAAPSARSGIGHRVTVEGIGPRVWLEDTGRGPAPEEADADRCGRAADRRRGVIAATGEGLDEVEFRRLLTWCRLAPAQIASTAAATPDPGIPRSSP